MADASGQRQRERAQARAERRSRAEGTSESAVGPELKRAATTAVAAALAGGLAGAAKALRDQRSRDGDVDDRPKAGGGDDAVPDGDVEQPDQPEQHHEGQSEDGEREEDRDSTPTGAPSGDVAGIIERAKEHVQQVLGLEPESISGIERADGKWSVAVEVVQLRRVPESTDVLASYAVVLDGDGDLISVQERRRYRRSQAGEDR